MAALAARARAQLPAGTQPRSSPLYMPLNDHTHTPSAERLLKKRMRPAGFSTILSVLRRPIFGSLPQQTLDTPNLCLASEHGHPACRAVLCLRPQPQPCG